MSVELLDSPRFYGYRVRRQIGGKAYQGILTNKRRKETKRQASYLDKNQAEQRDAELKNFKQK